MKKIAFTTVALALLLSMFGCSADQPNVEPEKPQDDATVTASADENVEPADKSDLRKAINKNGDYREEDYTDDSWIAYKTALDKAFNVNAKEDATESEVSKATESLNRATANLKEKIEPITISGAGADVVEVPENLAVCLVSAQHSGDSNFSIWSLDANMENVDLLVNTIGAYSGTTTTGLGRGTAKFLEIEGDGEWTVTMSPMSEAHQLENGEQRFGDDVVFLNATGAKKLSIINDGESNFSIWAFGSSKSDLLVNEIGSYSGTVANKGYSLLVVNSEGTWSVTW